MRALVACGADLSAASAATAAATAAASYRGRRGRRGCRTPSPYRRNRVGDRALPMQPTPSRSAMQAPPQPTSTAAAVDDTQALVDAHNAARAQALRSRR